MLSSLCPHQDRQPVTGKVYSIEDFRDKVQQLEKTDSLRLQSVFSDQDINQIHRDLGLSFRARVFAPAVTLGLFVSQVLNRDEPCSATLTRFNRQRKDAGQTPVSTDASAYCRARGRLPRRLIDELNRRVVKIAETKANNDWKWRGRNVYLIDGFTVRAPDTDHNQQEYPQSKAQQPGLGFPQLRCVTATSLATRAIVQHEHGQLDGKGNGEASLFRKMFGYFKPGDIVVGDSNFDSYHDMAVLLAQGVYCVFGISSGRDNPFDTQCDAQNEEVGEVIGVLKRPDYDATRFTRKQWEALPKTLTVRIIRYKVAGRDEYKTIVTTLLDQVADPAEAIAGLYAFRWEAEGDIRCLKTAMGMADLRCLTPENLRIELAINVLAYNLVIVLISDCAEVHESHPRQISFSQARDSWIQLGDQLGSKDEFYWIIESATGRIANKRFHRSEPREVKRRFTKYDKLKKPRPSKAKKLTVAA